MLNLILQRFVPFLTAITMMLNTIGGFFGINTVIPYNPVRTDVVVSGDVTTDIDAVLECYNSAVKKTGFVIGEYSVDVIGTPTASVQGDSSVDMSYYWEILENEKTHIFKVPGEGGILKSDVKSAKMSAEDGKISVIIKIKDTKRSGEGGEDAISRAYGWSSDYSDMFSSLGANMISGEITDSYTDSTISCVIDENSGKIIYGDWDSTGRMVADDLKLSMFDIEFTMDMDFTITTHYDV